MAYKYALDYLNNAFFNPDYFSGYYPIWNLLKDDSYEEISRYFSLLEKKDVARSQYSKYKQEKVENYFNALLLSPMIKNNFDIRQLSLDIFQTNHMLQYMFPKFIFIQYNRSEFFKRYIVKGESSLKQLQKEKKGCIIASHHWGAFQFSMLYLIARNYPLDVVISDEFKDHFLNLFPKESFPNLKFLYVNSGNVSAETITLKTLLECANDIRQGRFVFSLTDNPVNSHPSKMSTLFLGASIRQVRFAVALAQKLRCPIVHIAATINSKRADELIHLDFSDFMDLSMISNSTEPELIRASNKHMESILMQHPSNWTYADWFSRYMYLKQNETGTDNH